MFPLLAPRFNGSTLPAVFVLVVSLGACVSGDSNDAESIQAILAQDPLAEPQATSLFGEALFATEDTTGAIAAADEALLESPGDLERIIAAARVRRGFWQYRQAMALYTKAMELAPEDWRLYRFRGHRHISVRQFDKAISDLERARELAPFNWDVSYHLGLAYFVSGRLEDAADEYARCLGLATDPEANSAHSEGFRSCSANGNDPESLVAMTEWGYRAALRTGREAAAAALLEAVPLDLDVEENIAYYHDLLLYKGVLTVDQLLNPGPDAPYRAETVGYGVANWYLVSGDTARAVELLEELVVDEWWPGFGRIASEAELARLTGR